MFRWFIATVNISINGLYTQVMRHILMIVIKCVYVKRSHGFVYLWSIWSSLLLLKTPHPIYNNKGFPLLSLPTHALKLVLRLYHWSDFKLCRTNYYSWKNIKWIIILIKTIDDIMSMKYNNDLTLYQFSNGHVS